MSISDFSISSPRKGGRESADKSITYNEEFEKFLNDGSESDATSTNYMKQNKYGITSKPSWLNDDQIGKSSKSFLKQTKSSANHPQLVAPLESDEFDHQDGNDQEDKIIADYRSSLNDANMRMDDIIDEDDEEENVPKLNLDNSSISTSSRFVEPKPRTSLERRQKENQTAAGPADDDDDFEMDQTTRSSDPRSSSRISGQTASPKQSFRQSGDDFLQKTAEQPAGQAGQAGLTTTATKVQFAATTMTNSSNEPVGNNNTNTNLLSKVMFMDSLESGGGAGATLERSGNVAGASGGGGILKNASQKPSSTLNNINESDIGETQAHNDLIALRNYYSNFAVTDSGLNTLIRTNEDQNESKLNRTIVKQQQPQKKAIAASSDQTANSSASAAAFGLQAVRAIRDEIEERTLKEILAEIELNNNNSNKKKQQQQPLKLQNRNKSPDAIAAKIRSKYQNVASSGYGRPGWSPNVIKKQQQPLPQQPSRDQSPKNKQQQTRTRSRESADREMKPRFPRKSSQHGSLEYLNRSNNSNRDDSAGGDNNKEEAKHYKEEIHNLRGKLIQQSDKYELEIKDLHSEYEKQIGELKVKIADLTNKINSNKDDEKAANLAQKHKNSLKDLLKKNDYLTGSDNCNELLKMANEKIEELEKKLKEQEGLITGYQSENERLYKETKSAKEDAKQMQRKFDEESQKLKYELLQERLGNEKKALLRRSQSKEEQHVQQPIEPVKLIKEDETPNKFMPTMEESELTKKAASNYEEELRDLRIKLADANNLNKSLNESIEDLKYRLEYYEKNQQQIELDVRIIESKNNEIKRLNDRLKALESNRNAPDCLKQIKRLENQLKELNTLLIRYKKPAALGSDAANAINVANMTLDYYEKRIDRLESQLKEKTYDLERFSRMWEQKYFLYKEIYEEPTRDRDEMTAKSNNNNNNNNNIRPIYLDKKISEIEVKYFGKCDDLDMQNKKLRKDLEEKQTQLINKQNEIEQLKLDYAELVAQIETENHKNLKNLQKEQEQQQQHQESQQQQQQQQTVVRCSKIYEPDLFRTSIAEILMPIREPITDEHDLSDSLRKALNECDYLKKKVSNLDSDLKLRDREHDLNRQQMKQAFDKKLTSLAEKHRNEMEILVRTLTGTSGLMADESIYLFKSEWDSPLNDTSRMKYLMNARDNFNSLKQVIERQKKTIKDLVDSCNQLNDYKTRYLKLEVEADEMKSELDSLKSTATANFTPEMRDFDNLNQKLKQMEKKLAINQRGAGGSPSTEKFNNLIKQYEHQLMVKNREIEKFRAELDTMLQLLKTLQKS